MGKPLGELYDELRDPKTPKAMFQLFSALVLAAGLLVAGFLLFDASLGWAPCAVFAASIPVALWIRTGSPLGDIWHRNRP